MGDYVEFMQFPNREQYYRPPNQVNTSPSEVDIHNVIEENKNTLSKELEQQKKEKQDTDKISEDLFKVEGVEKNKQLTDLLWEIPNKKDLNNTTVLTTNIPLDNKEMMEYLTQLLKHIKAVILNNKNNLKNNQNKKKLINALRGVFADAGLLRSPRVQVNNSLTIDCIAMLFYDGIDGTMARSVSQRLLVHQRGFDSKTNLTGPIPYLHMGSVIPFVLSVVPWTIIKIKRQSITYKTAIQELVSAFGSWLENNQLDTSETNTNREVSRGGNNKRTKKNKTKKNKTKKNKTKKNKIKKNKKAKHMSRRKH
jgi:hypothetical protein